MKTKELLQAMGDIRPEYIESALKPSAADAITDSADGFVPDVSEPQGRSVRFRIVTAAGLAACAALAVVCGFWLYRTGRAARADSALTNLEVSQTVGIEPAATADSGTTDAGTQMVGSDDQAAELTAVTGSTATDPSDFQTTAYTGSGTDDQTPQEQTAVTVKSESTGTSRVSSGTVPAQTAQSTEPTGSVQTSASSSAVQNSAGMDCILFKDYGTHVKMEMYPGNIWQVGVPVSAVLHGLNNIYERNAAGDLLDEAFHAFLTEDETKNWRTDAFFEKNDVIVGMVYLGSGSYELGVKDLGMVSSTATGKTELRLNLIAYQPECMDCAMCCYYYAISVPKGVIEGYMRVNTNLSWISPTYDPVTEQMTDDRYELWRKSCWPWPAMYYVPAGSAGIQ